MSEKAKVPAIRFKGFTDLWEQRKLRDLCIIFTDGDWIESKDQSDSGVRLVQTGNVGIAEYLDKPNNRKWISEDTFARLNCEEVLPGDILISRLPEPAGRACIMPFLDVRMITAVDCTIARTASDYSNKFLIQYLSSQYYFNEVNAALAGGTRQRISRSNLARFYIPTPVKYEEQEAIGKYFKQLDNLIALHQRKLLKLKNVKKAMLEKMFPKNGSNVPEIRFAGFTDAWELRKLGQFGKATSGTSIESEFTEGGKYKVISIGSYSEMSIYTDQSIRADKTKKTESRILNKDDLTMILNDKTASGNIIGRVLLIEADNTYIYNQRTERIEVNKNDYEPRFLYQFLNADNIRSKIIRASQGNTQIYVNWSVISELEYAVPPSISEQKQIGDFITNLDNFITLHQRKYEKLQNIKKACLEKMFV